MNKDTQKRVAIASAALIVLYLVYRWRQSQSNTNAAATGTSAPATDTSASDYASLAGQEQGDMAALQSQNQQLLAQEQSDVASLQANESGLGGFISTLGAQVAGITPPNLAPLTAEIAGLSTQVAALATGEQQLKRQLNQKKKPPKKPPKRGGGTRTKSTTAKRDAQQTKGAAGALRTMSDGVLRTFDPATRRQLAGLFAQAHPSAPHNTQVAHPNANHLPQTGGGKASHNKPGLPQPKAKPIGHPKTRSSGRRR